MNRPEMKNLDHSEPQPVPALGSLGLLAYGYKGLLAWRQARDKNDKIGDPGNHQT